LVLGINEKLDIDKYVEEIESGNENHIQHTETQDIKDFYPSRSYDDRTRCFLKVQDGCDYYCTYCTIPYARGKSRSGSIEDIIKETHKAVEEGAKEVVITGVNIGDFGRGHGVKFIDLIKELEKTDGIDRYRISSIEPNLLSDEIIEFVSKSDKFAPHFHIPLQSGSNDVLKLMGRRYKRELFQHKIELIKQMIPNAFIGVDVIVGTRGETPEFFEDSKNFIESLPISQLHVFSYSERAGTKALQIPYIVSADEKKRRSAELHEISERKIKDFYQSHQGQKATVLWENTNKNGYMFGFTENYIRVTTPYDKTLVNTFQAVELGEFSDDKILSLKVKP
ncbi:MAG: MiaB/RimO family radical SAM methylthiotransferase, partial [Paludibacteraceae bacterium]|nr:MiaB/RimO family radical SAM methylthiotransferase [Paludibacteraceae bacterium]